MAMVVVAALPPLLLLQVVVALAPSLVAVAVAVRPAPMASTPALVATEVLALFVSGLGDHAIRNS
jgi:hypothetical protein